MFRTLATLIDRLDSAAVAEANVIRWGSPVPCFGDLPSSRLATLGLNPSNREFIDELGNELQGVSRRFETLKSLGLESWYDVDARHLHLILQSCRKYFLGNPYNRWFAKLDQIVGGLGTSYYDPSAGACHLDLIPYATATKWTELSSQQRSALLLVAGDALGFLLRDSAVQILVLNGKSVVEHFQRLSGVFLNRDVIPSWSLPRNSQTVIPGIAYSGWVDTVSGIQLGRRVLVLGFNHNLQSSFGVTTKVIHAIRRWIARAAEKLVQ